MTRFVGREATVRIKVYAIAKSEAEADAIEAAIRALPVSEAWLPKDPSELPPVAPPATTVADHATPTEDALPPAALADSDDNVGGLKAGEAVP